MFLVAELWLLWDYKLGIYGNRSFKYPKHCHRGGRSSFLKGPGSNIYFEVEMNQQAVSKEHYFQVQRNCSFATMCKSGDLCVLRGYKTQSFLLRGSNIKQEGLVFFEMIFPFFFRNYLKPDRL